MASVIHWRDVAPSGEAFHAFRGTKTHRNPVSCHGHDFAEVFWIDSGCGVHRVNGAEFPLEPGSVVLIRPPDTHGIEPLSGQTVCLTNIAFPKESYDFLESRYFLHEPWAFCSRDQYPVALKAEPAKLSLFNEWADTLAQSPQERLSIERFLLNLLGDLRPQAEDLMPRHTPDWLLHACREIQKPAHLAGGVEQFVRLASRSREHVARSTRRSFGLSPTQYVNRVRMVYASRQLAMSSQGILEIAMDCGLSNLSHFYTLFREEFGVTPRAYRVSHSKAAIPH